jgi:hypothetical protein
MSEIVLCRLKTRISAHCNEFAQNRLFFAISPNSGGFKYFPRKCGGFLELTHENHALFLSAMIVYCPVGDAWVSDQKLANMGHLPSWSKKQHPLCWPDKIVPKLSRTSFPDPRPRGFRDFPFWATA